MRKIICQMALIIKKNMLFLRRVRNAKINTDENEKKFYLYY
jgi:hypothetical protein